MTPEHRHELWSGSLTLGERIDLLRSNAAGRRESRAGEAEAVSAQWCDRCAKGDPEKFAARLAWDGLAPADVQRLVEVAPATTAEPAWLSFFAEVIECFQSGLRAENIEAPADLPFREVWAAFAEVGRRSLPRRWQKPSIAGFLARRLSPLGAPVLYAHFDRFRTEQTGENDAYEAWLRRARDGGLAALFRQFPVLARTLAQITVSAVETIREMTGRWKLDRVSALRLGVTGEPVALDPGLSDRHYDGRQVARLTFADGSQLIYKPKTIDLDAGFQELLAMLGREMPEIFPVPLQNLRCDGYGWVEGIAHEEFGDRREVEHYFRRGGGLLALAYALEGRDFIMDNLIATHVGPAAIDAETALQPLCMPGGAEKFDRAVLLEQLLKGRDFSVLDTGLLPLWMPAAGGFYDLSGLGGQTGYLSALRQEAWEDVGTGAMRCVPRAVLVEAEKNQVRLNGVPQAADGYVADIERGFVAGYRAILARRDEILECLGGWNGRQLRFLLRSTNTYGQLMKKMLVPDSLRSGLICGIEAEILYRPWISGPTPPPIADFLRREVEALQRFDVPCFHLTGDGTEHPYFLASPLAMARDRLSRLGADDLEKQRRVLRASVILKPRADLGGIGAPPDPFPDATVAKAAASKAWRFPKVPLIAQAEAVGKALLSLDESEDRPASDRSDGDGSAQLLYDGAPGLAILFAALWVATERPRWREPADRFLENWLLDVHSDDFRTRAQSLPIGAASGLASLAYAVWLCARLRQEPRLTDSAVRMAGLVTREMISRDSHLDVFSGAAGAALVFASLAEEPHQDEIFRERAEWAAERLVESAIEVPRWDGVVWEAGGERYLGYGHGAAGIAAALARVGALTGRAEFLDTARRAYRLIHNLYSEANGLWPHLLRGDEPVFQKMESLCHGTPGVTLGFAEGVRSGVLRDMTPIARARARLESLDPHPIDTLCCGNAGQFEALLAIGVDVEFISKRLLTILKRREPLGLFRTALRRSDIYSCPTGFFRGLPGVAYSLLRLGEPQVFPSVAAWR